MKGWIFPDVSPLVVSTPPTERRFPRGSISEDSNILEPYTLSLPVHNRHAFGTHDSQESRGGRRKGAPPFL